LGEDTRTRWFYDDDSETILGRRLGIMRRTSYYHLLSVLALLSFTLAACSSGNDAEGSLAVAESAAPATQETEVPSPTPEPSATAQPTETPGIEPQYTDLGNGVALIDRGTPQDVIVEGRLDADLVNKIPDSRNWDSLHSDMAAIQITQDGQPASVERGALEICFSTTMTPMDERPVPYYWDTSSDPLSDGRQQRVSHVETDPALVVCTMVEKGGAYALVAR
jgi:hypothetical protein